MTINDFENWVYSVVPRPTCCLTCTISDSFRKNDIYEGIAKQYGRKNTWPTVRNNEEWDIDPMAGLSYQLTEKLLLLGVHPREFVEHKTVKGRLSYHPGKGLEFEDFCIGIGQKELMQVVKDLIEEKNSGTTTKRSGE